MDFKNWFLLQEVKWTKDDHFKDPNLIWHGIRQHFLSMEGYCKKMLQKVIYAEFHHQSDDPRTHREFQYGLNPLEDMPSATLISTDEVGLIIPESKKKKYEKDPHTGLQREVLPQMGVDTKEVKTYIVHPRDVEGELYGKGGGGDWAAEDQSKRSESYQGTVVLVVDLSQKANRLELRDTIAHELYHALDDWDKYPDQSDVDYRDKAYEKPAWRFGGAWKTANSAVGGQAVEPTSTLAGKLADREVRKDPKELRRYYRDLARMKEKVPDYGEPKIPGMSHPMMRPAGHIAAMAQYRRNKNRGRPSSRPEAPEIGSHHPINWLQSE